nr:ubiquitin carboxyl-terminal hydrolase 24-like [Pongo pygmaeus]
MSTGTCDLALSVAVTAPEPLGKRAAPLWGEQQNVEKLKLMGIDFIWKITMKLPDEEIPNEAVQLIIKYSYGNLNPSLKRMNI